MNTDNAIYVYGFCHAPSMLPIADAIDENYPLFAHEVNGLVAIVSLVKRGEFEGEEAETRLKDIVWLAPRIYRHSKVLEKILDLGCPVYPVNFGTLFSSLDALISTMHEQRNLILAHLEHVKGRQEWAIDIQFDQDQALEMLVAEAVSKGQLLLSTSMGRRHLEMQRYRANLITEMPIWLDGRLRSVADDLEVAAADHVERKVGGEKVANWAYLISAQEVQKFLLKVERLSQRESPWGLTLRCTGPWPPYSFCKGVS